jgi:Mg2+-importing ATPase
VSLAAGLTTEFLWIIVTAMLSANAQRMVWEKVIVRRLEAIQDLGTMDSLCREKTRTRAA